MNAPDETPGEVLSPAQRLEASRARLRKSWLRETPEIDPDAPAHDDGSWMHRITELVTTGWDRHPLKASLDAASTVAGPAFNAALGPVARAHPLRLVALAVGIGAVVVWVRPWRLLSRAALSSLLISAIVPKKAITRWVASGQWMDVLRNEQLQAWFASRAVAAERPARSAAAAAPVSDRQAPAGESTSYATRAPSPIPEARTGS